MIKFTSRKEGSLADMQHQKTTITIMFEPTNVKFSGTPFVRNMENVNTLRNYPLQQGTNDKMQGTLEINRHIYNAKHFHHTTNKFCDD
ncbi:MAG: hypothetical protein LBC03_04575 [Nitrososphaerota archaeon]|jgi:hypothetical protein|nr:hypothetical protein [Nitrososphaerota archaeon]